MGAIKVKVDADNPEAAIEAAWERGSMGMGGGGDIELDLELCDFAGGDAFTLPYNDILVEAIKDQGDIE